VASTWQQCAKRLGANLKKRRVSLELTQEDVAERGGIAVRHYQKLEAGEVNVTLRTLVRLSAALKAELSSLL
jgi:transcriptional regulator with XRE-family HTH domain